MRAVYAENHIHHTKPDAGWSRGLVKAIERFGGTSGGEQEGRAHPAEKAPLI